MATGTPMFWRFSRTPSFGLKTANPGRIGSVGGPIADESSSRAGYEPSPVPGISRNVLLLSAVSLLNDISGEMVYPLVPLFLSITLGAPASIVGVIEGFAE